MTDDIEKEEEFALAAEYTLGLLSPEEARAFEDLLAVDPAFREDYVFWADSFAALTDDIPPVTPPANMQAKIEADLFGATETAKKPSIWERMGLVSALGGGLLAALAVLWLVDLSGVMESPSTPTYTAQIAAEDNSLVIQASYNADTEVLTLARIEGAARDGRALELWLIAGDNPPVSLGVLPETENAEFRVDPTLVAALDGGTLAISDEPPGGSPTGSPTGDVLAVGPITTL